MQLRRDVNKFGGYPISDTTWGLESELDERDEMRYERDARGKMRHKKMRTEVERNRVSERKRIDSASRS